MIHDAMHHVLDILDMVFYGVLVLVVWVRLAVFDGVHAKHVLHCHGGLGLGIVKFETHIHKQLYAHRKSRIWILGKLSFLVNKSAYTKMMYIYEKPFFRSTFVYIS